MRSCLVLASEFPPKNTAGVHRSLRFCQFLPEFGWVPRVITTDVEEPGGNKLLSKVSPDLEIIRVGPSIRLAAKQTKTETVDEESTSGLKRLKSWLRPFSQLLTETPDRSVAWSRLAEKKGRQLLSQQTVDVIYSSGPPHSVHLAARKLASTFKIPWIADFRDPWARRPWGTSQNPWGRKLIPMFERQVVETAAAVVLNTPTSCSDFCNAYPALSNKFHCIPNGLDPDLLATVRQIASTARPENAIPVLCHPGNLYGHRDPANTIRAIAALSSQSLPIKFQQIGAIADHLKPNSLTKELGVPELYDAISSLPHHETLLAMHQADILLIIQPDAPLMVPSKAYEMLAFDRPIVAVCDSPCTESVVKDAGGFTAPSRDVAAIAMALQKAHEYRHDTNRLQLRENARTKYDGRNLTKELADLMSRVAAQSDRN